jgi:hypothetical protein
MEKITFNSYKKYNFNVPIEEIFQKLATTDDIDLNRLHINGKCKKSTDKVSCAVVTDSLRGNSCDTYERKEGWSRNDKQFCTNCVNWRGISEDQVIKILDVMKAVKDKKIQLNKIYYGDLYNPIPKPRKKTPAPKPFNRFAEIDLVLP